MKYCPNCGAQIEPNWKHCNYCGSRVNENAQENTTNTADVIDDAPETVETAGSTQAEQITPPAPQPAIVVPQDQPSTKTPGNGFSTASLIFGIVSAVCVLCCCCFYVPLFISLIAGVLAVVFAIVSKNKTETRTMPGTAKIGMILGILGFALGLVMVIIYSVLMATGRMNLEFYSNLEEGKLPDFVQEIIDKMK
jgi:uncharacterized integral membrane protein